MFSQVFCQNHSPMTKNRILEVQKLIDKWNVENARKHSEVGSTFFKRYAENALLDDNDDQPIRMMKSYLQSVKDARIKKNRIKKMNVAINIVDGKMVIVKK